MKQFFAITLSTLLLCVSNLTGSSINSVDLPKNANLTDDGETVATSLENAERLLVNADYNSPQAAVKAFIVAWRKKSRSAMLKIAEKDVVDGINNLIKGSTFRGCKANTESARKTYNCTVQAGKDDLTAVYLEVVLTRVGYRIMSIDYAAAN